ncbi:MAG: ABC transporter permease subunit [Ilumatobacteraceae bacterium]
MSDYDVTGPILLLGTTTGLAYALLGIGLVLTYRSSRFINFAHGAIGLFGASLMGVVVNDYAVPYWLGFAAALCLSAGLGAGTEVVLVRRLERAPKVLSMVATLGAAEALLLLALSFNSGGLGGRTFPRPPWFPEFDVGPLFVSAAGSALLILTPIVLLALGLFLTRTRYGIAIRGAASNPDAAALAGADPKSMAMLSWAMAGGIAAFSAMLVLPTQGAVTPETLGPDFIVRGLTVAVLARFSSLTIAVAAGIFLGVLEQVLATNPSSAGYFEVAMFLMIFVGVLWQHRSSRDDTEEWAAVAEQDRTPAVYERVWLIRNLRWVVGTLAVVAAMLVPIWITNRSAFILSTILAFAIIGMSVAFLTGLAGQLSLGQAAFAAFGAVIAIPVVTETGNLLLGFLAAAALGAVLSAVVGLPSQRVKGLLFGVVTLSFALATSAWALRQSWAFGRTGVSTPTVTIAGIEIDTSRRYYYVALITFVVVLAIASALWRGRFGRRLVAVRDNDAAARVLQISPFRARTAAYGVAGMIAGLGGAVLAFANSQVTGALFSPVASIDAVAIAVIGGITNPAGSLLGAAFLIGIPRFFNLELQALAGLNAAWLILILEQPRGISGLLSSTHARLLDAIARTHGIDPEAARAGQVPPEEDEELHVLVRGERAHEVSSDVLLEVADLRLSFGRLVAVDDVSFQIRAGETVGLIGPNGAGKTTTFELVSGFVKPDAGTVTFDGHDITRLSPERRSDLGIVRSFQNAELFPTLSPRETLTIAHERAHRHDTARRRRAGADAGALLDLFGLSPYADLPNETLSTGSRRLVELAANLAMEPRLLLLDEPSAGIAQAETEALADVLERVRSAYGVTMVVIEHDMPMLTQISDRMIAMEVGSVIAAGTPEDVQRDPLVVESYLGADPTAIARSG